MRFDIVLTSLLGSTCSSSDSEASSEIESCSISINSASLFLGGSHSDALLDPLSG